MICPFYIGDVQDGLHSLQPDSQQREEHSGRGGNQELGAYIQVAHTFTFSLHTIWQLSYTYKEKCLCKSSISK